MLPIKRLMFFLPLFLAIKGQAQQVVVTYTKTREMDVTAAFDKIPEKAQQVLLAARDQLENYSKQFTLRINGNKSEFKMIPGSETNLKSAKISIYSYENKDIYQKDFLTQKVDFLLHNYDDSYYIQGQIPKFNWQLTSEHKFILGYPCQKAVLNDYNGSISEAWFTQIIPVSNGPKEYVGLPGLILELTEGKRKYLATEVNINSTERISIDAIQTRMKPISLSEFRTIVQNKETSFRAHRRD